MITLNINNEEHKLDVDPQMPLLWAIRDIVELRGTKFGCGKGLCGACTVWVNGEPVKSCSYPVSGAKNSKVTTIEGLSEDGNHPVQVAWREHKVPQCGYCQSGQIMAAAALLKDTPKPSDEQIDTTMAGNICRCGTYPRIKKAIKSAAKNA